MHDLWKRSAEKEVVQAQTIVVAAPKEFFVEKKKKLGFLSKHFPLIDRLYLSELKKSNTLPIEDKYARMQKRIRYPAFSFLTHKSTS